MNEQQRAVVQQALEALKGLYAITEIAQEDIDCRFAWAEMPDAKEAITALRKLLEQPEPVQGPQTFLHWYDNAHWGNEDFKDGCHRSWNAAIKYTTPPAQPADHGDELTIAYLDGVHTGKKMAKREWVGLTEEELYAVRVPMSPQEIARAVEQRLKEKNGGA
jgi:hypothetical protein